jgi:hypothetical protein
MAAEHVPKSHLRLPDKYAKTMQTLDLADLFNIHPYFIDILESSPPVVLMVQSSLAAKDA